ncbi:hypothetical protein CONPUDRAFT_169554 [Coniophora puteana RWD-64-598 SS2]|uniref:BRCT domain-containing protein n=1 Tax=Coniophora puteana (strain RWD-64-598) TaxID=741705 RepID=A0A5M3M875_CONPW|nr:uncharacterized protein CONPUDRAFT_169554 [Coniophora puteana RWD-64-598 SS2]EIW75136.1 hypothetical protein CONPUDRAFT_169554 [Coniophora puteana RWD-64-598 SS2]
MFIKLRPAGSQVIQATWILHCIAHDFIVPVGDYILDENFRLKGYCELSTNLPVGTTDTSQTHSSITLAPASPAQHKRKRTSPAYLVDNSASSRKKTAVLPSNDIAADDSGIFIDDIPNPKPSARPERRPDPPLAAEVPVPPANNRSCAPTPMSLQPTGPNGTPHIDLSKLRPLSHAHFARSHVDLRLRKASRKVPSVSPFVVECGSARSNAGNRFIDDAAAGASRRSPTVKLEDDTSDAGLVVPPPSSSAARARAIATPNGSNGDRKLVAAAATASAEKDALVLRADDLLRIRNGLGINLGGPNSRVSTGALRAISQTWNASRQPGVPRPTTITLGDEHEGKRFEKRLQRVQVPKGVKLENE